MTRNQLLSCATGIALLAAISLNVFAAPVPRPEHPRPDAFRAN